MLINLCAYPRISEDPLSRIEIRGFRLNFRSLLWSLPVTMTLYNESTSGSLCCLDASIGNRSVCWLKIQNLFYLSSKASGLQYLHWNIWSLLCLCSKEMNLLIKSPIFISFIFLQKEGWPDYRTWIFSKIMVPKTLSIR